MTPMKSGTRLFGETECSFEGGTRWVLLDAAEVNGLSGEDIICRLGWEGFSGGPGRPYSDTGFVKRTKRRVLVTQRFGWDV